MYIRPEIQKLAEVSAEKQASLNLLYNVGKKIVPKLWNATKAAPGVAARGTLNAAKAAPGVAARGAVTAAKFPVTSAIDAVKSVPQIAGTAGAIIPKSFNPKKAYKHVTDHYGQGHGFRHGARNFIKDVGGVRPYSVKQNQSGVMKDIGRAMWNPRIPTVRRNAAFNTKPFTKGIGSGQDVGKPILATGLATGAYGVGRAVDNAIVNAPITGNSAVDNQIPIEDRKKFTRNLAYKSIPSVLYSGLVSGNEVDRKAINTLVSQLGRQTMRGGLEGLQDAGRGNALSLKKLLTKHVISNTAAAVKKPGVLPSANVLRAAIAEDVDKGKRYKQELEDSALSAAIQQGMSDLRIPENYEKGKDTLERAKRLRDNPSDALREELIKNSPELKAILEQQMAKREALRNSQVL